MIGHLEVGFGRVAGEDQRAQVGIAAGGGERGQHPGERVARLVVADTGRDVRFDLILAGFAVKAGIDAEPLRAAGIGRDITLHFVFGRANARRDEPAPVRFPRPARAGASANLRFPRYCCD